MAFHGKNKQNSQNDAACNESAKPKPNNRNLLQYAKNAIWVFVICVVALFLTGEFILYRSCSSEHGPIPLTSHITTECDSLDKIITTTNSKTANDKKISSETITTAKSSSNISRTSTNASAELLDSIVYNLTLAVNSINNILTGGTIALAVVTLFFGFIGFLGFHSLKEDIKEHKQETSDRLNSINNLYDELKRSEEKQKTLTNYISSLNMFLDKINIVIYSSASAITNQMDFAEKQLSTLQNDYDAAEKSDLNQQNRELLNNLSHQIKIMQLYKMCLTENTPQDEVFAVFAHFKAKGSIDDCTHLEYIKENCPNIINSKQAQETIWYIHDRIRNEKKTS